MGLIFTNSPLTEFGRGSMTELTRYVKNYTSSRPNYQYQVEDRVVTSDYDWSKVIVPFVVNLSDPDGTVHKTYAVITPSNIYFYFVDKTSNDYSFSTIYESDTSSRIYGWGNSGTEYDINVTLPLAYMSEGQDKSKFREYTYCSSDNDFFVYRVEDKSYNSVAEIWVTSDGHIQLFQNTASPYLKSLYSKIPSTQTLTETPVTCVSGICPYQIAIAGRGTIKLSGTATESGSLSVRLYYKNVPQIQTVSISAGDTAESIATRLKDLTWTSGTSKIKSEDNNYYVIFDAKNSGEFYIVLGVRSSSGKTHVGGLNVGYRFDTEEYYKCGQGAILCSHYDTSRTSCAYGAYTTTSTSSEKKSEYSISTEVLKKLRLMTQLKGDGTLVTPNYTSHYRTSLNTGFCGSIEISRGSNSNSEFLNLYTGSLTDRPSYKPLMLRLNGADVRANFMPVSSSPVEADVKVDFLRLRYGDTTYCGVNPAKTADNMFSVPCNVDKTLNHLYVNNSNYRWENIDIYGVYPVLKNVVKVRVIWFTGSSVGTYTNLPNISYPDLYFSYQSAYDDTGSVWRNAYQSGGVVTLSSTETNDVQNRPHLVEFTFSSPTDVAQWIISPRSVSGSYIVPNMINQLLAINFILSDGKSVKYI